MGISVTGNPDSFVQDLNSSSSFPNGNNRYAKHASARYVYICNTINGY